MNLQLTKSEAEILVKMLQIATKHPDTGLDVAETAVAFSKRIAAASQEETEQEEIGSTNGSAGRGKRSRLPKA